MTRQGRSGHQPPPPATPSRPALRTLQVSRTTARFLADGHPWVRPDRYTRGLAELRPGEAVTLVDEDGRRLASALADPQAEICARVYHRRPDMAFHPLQALERALQRRAALLADPLTDCYRVVHGEGDHLPGLRIERYQQVYVVVLFAACIAPYAETLCRGLLDLVPAATVVRKDHQDDLRRAAVSCSRLDGAPVDPEVVVIGRELGVRYPVRPFAGLATGLYVDQRATRAWLAPLCPGRRVLNLFSDTGAFSLAALQAGALQALDCDLAAPALARAQEAADLNGLGDRLQCRKGDCRTILESLDERFELIICDPPTSAQGAGGWILRRDYPAVLRLALSRLAPDGILVACCNTIGGKPFDLARAITGEAEAAGIAITRLPAPPLGADLPQLEGFPEGRPFRLVAVRRAAAS